MKRLHEGIREVIRHQWAMGKSSSWLASYGWHRMVLRAAPMNFDAGLYNLSRLRLCEMYVWAILSYDARPRNTPVDAVGTRPPAMPAMPAVADGPRPTAMPAAAAGTIPEGGLRG